MFDRSIPNIRLRMRADSLENLPVFDLPEGYGWRFYRDGDEAHWASIETSAEEFFREADALNRFFREFPDAEERKRRMIFITHDDIPVGTATAWWDENGEGLLHWVGIETAHQGKGLCKPLVSLAMQRMKALGYPFANLHTQTCSWIAIKVYRQFGFKDLYITENAAEGWRIVEEKLNGR